MRVRVGGWGLGLGVRVRGRVQLHQLADGAVRHAVVDGAMGDEAARLDAPG